MGKRPSIYGVVHGEPFDPNTYSTTSINFFGELQRQDHLVGAGNVALPKPAEYFNRLVTFSPSKPRWKDKYQVNRTRGFVQRRLGNQLLKELHPAPDAVVQIGSWYQLSRPDPKTLLIPYLDGNFAVWMRRYPEHLGQDSRFAQWRYRHEQRIYDDSDLVFTMSEWLRESMINDFNLDEDKVVAIGAGTNIDRPDVIPPRDDFPPRFLFVGKKFIRKGGPTVLEAFRLVKKAVPEAELWVVGLTEDLPPQDGVTFFGRLNRQDPAGDAELQRIYSEATAFVMPSVAELQGMVYLEAMAYGLPVIATGYGAQLEMVLEKQTGYLVEHSRPEELAERMIVLADSAHAAKLGRAGRALLDEKFLWSDVVDRAVAAIKAKVESRSPASVPLQP